MGNIEDKLPSINMKKTSARGDQKVHQLKVGSIELFPYECEGTGWGDPTRLQQEFVKDYLKETIETILGAVIKGTSFAYIFLFDLEISPYVHITDIGDPLNHGDLEFSFIDFWGNTRTGQIPALSNTYRLTFNKFFKFFTIGGVDLNTSDKWGLYSNIIKLENYKEMLIV